MCAWSDCQKPSTIILVLPDDPFLRNQFCSLEHLGAWIVRLAAKNPPSNQITKGDERAIEACFKALINQFSSPLPPEYTSPSPIPHTGTPFSEINQPQPPDH